MSRVLPYPLLTASLVLMWMLLNAFSLGHLLLGTLVALIASWSMAALQPSKPRVRRWLVIPWLFIIVLYDVMQSNLAVAGVILQGRQRQRVSGFVAIPLDLRDPHGLAVLSTIINSTPGTVWAELSADHTLLMIHVLDLHDEQWWVDTIKSRYEKPLMAIFE